VYQQVHQRILTWGGEHKCKEQREVGTLYKILEESLELRFNILLIREINNIIT